MRPNPADGRKKGTKRHIIAEAHRIPLAVYPISAMRILTSFDFLWYESMIVKQFYPHSLRHYAVRFQSNELSGKYSEDIYEDVDKVDGVHYSKTVLRSYKLRREQVMFANRQR
jgi:hypothetical protein